MMGACNGRIIPQEVAAGPPDGDSGVVDTGWDDHHDGAPPGSDAPTGGDVGDDEGATMSCGPGNLLCGDTCVDTNLSATHCGDCGTACGPGQTCSNGVCGCGGSLANCDGICTDTSTNAMNCGVCGRACTLGQTCTAGTCTCQPNLTSCESSCVDLQSDNANCGACGKSCAGRACASGICVSSCPSGTANCGGSCVDVQTSASNCGGCGMACPAGLSCTGGVCRCPGGTALCGGVCVDVTRDSANCGGCGVACAVGTTCAGGSCACPGGKTLCGSTCVDITTDPSNCGACGKACGGGQVCAASSCGCGATVAYASQVQPIFTGKCTTGCHSGNRPAAGLSLVSGASYGALVNVASSCTTSLVKPGAPASSYLMNKLNGTKMCSGSQMPKSGGLAAADLSLINTWICEGAPNN